MRLYNMAELSRNAKSVVDTVAEEGSAVITSNGTPKTLMINIADGDFMELASLVRRILLEQAITATQLESTKRGTDNLSLDEINALIDEARTAAAACS